MPMGRALFDEKLEAQLELLARQFYLVQINIDSYVDDDGSDKSFTTSISRAIYDIEARVGQRNEISDAIKSAVDEIEAVCVPVLRLETSTESGSWRSPVALKERGASAPKIIGT